MPGLKIVCCLNAMCCGTVKIVKFCVQDNLEARDFCVYALTARARAELNEKWWENNPRQLLDD
jgi:hypothetical protein